MSDDPELDPLGDEELDPLVSLPMLEPELDVSVPVEPELSDELPDRGLDELELLGRLVFPALPCAESEPDEGEVDPVVDDPELDWSEEVLPLFDVSEPVDPLVLPCVPLDPDVPLCELPEPVLLDGSELLPELPLWVPDPVADPPL